jgi:hypothetical protein
MLHNLLKKIIYLFNTVDSYFLISGTLAIIIYSFFNPIALSLYLVPLIIFTYIIFKISDFHYNFLIFTPLFLFLVAQNNFDILDLTYLVLINMAIYYTTQFFLYSIPYVIILKDLTILFRVPFNSLFTLAPTSSSAIISIYFSSFFSYILYSQQNIKNKYTVFLFLALILAASITYKLLPKTKTSKNFKPEIKKKFTDRIIYVNIDGCRLDKFRTSNLKTYKFFKEKGAYFKKGATTVVRALTNPAIASILTGTTPKVHKIRNNNDTKELTLEAIPDIIPSILYGNIHIKDMNKKSWTAKEFSLPKYGIRIDDVLIETLKKDIKENKAKFYLADLSDVDIAGHGYGSYSKEYVKALKRTDRRIIDLISWLRKEKLLTSTIILVTSDHGQTMMEHAHLTTSSEKYVPLMFYGKNIKRTEINFVPSIIDLNPTISYLLGSKYTKNSKGRVLIEILQALKDV